MRRAQFRGIALAVAAVAAISGCGASHRRESTRAALSTTSLRRANAFCKQQDARIAKSEGRLVGNYSEQTVNEITVEIGELVELGIGKPLETSEREASLGLKDLAPGGLGPVDAHKRFSAARRAAYALGIRCSFGAFD